MVHTAGILVALTQGQLARETDLLKALAMRHREVRADSAGAESPWAYLVDRPDIPLVGESVLVARVKHWSQTLAKVIVVAQDLLEIVGARLNANLEVVVAQERDERL